MQTQDFMPLPPVEMTVYSATAEWAFFWIQLAICAAGFVYALIASRRDHTLIPLMCMVGGALTIVIEPLVDAQLQVWWPIHNQPDLFIVWGRKMPLMVLFIVTWYFGVGAILRWHWLEKNGAASRLWMVYAVEVGAALALEPPAIQLDLWHYYGHHGLRIFGYPVWWPFVGGACSTAAGTLVYKMAPYLKGWRVSLAALLVPMAVAATYWGVSWPMFFVLNLEPLPWLSYVTPFFSIGLAFVVVWMCTIATGHYALRQTKAAGLHNVGLTDAA